MSYTDYQQKTIDEAINIIQEQTLTKTDTFTSPDAVRDYLKLQIANETEEYFCAMYLDAQHQMIAFEKLFRGSVASASVYPRVVAKE